MKLKHKIIFSAVSLGAILSGVVTGSVIGLSTKGFQQTKTNQINQYNSFLKNKSVISSSNEKMANYQSQQYNILKNVPINRLNLIGSHDSGMYMTQESLGNDAEGAPKWLFNNGSSWQIKKLSRMQTKNIYYQLENGVRYLDLRISNLEGSNNFNINNIYTTHAVLGASIVSVVSQVAQFIANNPNELIILDFNHWYDGVNDKLALQTSVANYLWQAFGDTNSNLINKYNPHLKGSHLATNDSEYNFNQPFSNFIKLNGSTNKNIIISFADKYVHKNYIKNSYNSSDLYDLRVHANTTSNVISYWTQKYDWSEINSALTQFKNLQENAPNNIYIKQAIPNWNWFRYFQGYLQGVYGYQMDYWWSNKDHILDYIKSQNGYGGVILVNNAGTTQSLKDWIYMNPAYGNEYDKGIAETLEFNQPKNFYYARYLNIDFFAELANLLGNNGPFELMSANGINAAYPGKIVIDKYLDKTHQIEFHFVYLNKYQTKKFIINDVYKNSIENVKFSPTPYLHDWVTWNYHNWLSKHGKNATMNEFNIIAKKRPWEFYTITVNGKQVPKQAYQNFIKSIKLIWIGNNNEYNVQIWTSPKIYLNQSESVYYNGNVGGSIFTNVARAYININDYQKQISEINKSLNSINSNHLNSCYFNQAFISKGLDLATQQKNYLLQFSKNSNFQNQVLHLWDQINNKYNWILKYSSLFWNASGLYNQFKALMNQMNNLYNQQLKINDLNKTLNKIDETNKNWWGFNHEYINKAKILAQNENDFIKRFSNNEKIKLQASALWEQINSKYNWMLKYERLNWDASLIYKAFKPLVKQMQVLYNQTLN